MWLLHGHHQVQGLLQSGEYQRKCFWDSQVKLFLSTGPFVENWFGLWDLYEKWARVGASRAGRASSAQKDELGRSVRAVKGGLASRVEKDKEGRSVNAVNAARKTHAKKDERGKSLNAVRSGRAASRVAHSKKDEQGKSAVAVKGGLAVHAEKDELGRSIRAVEVCAQNFKQKYECLTTGFISTASGVAAYQRKRGLDSSSANRRRVEAG